MDSSLNTPEQNPGLIEAPGRYGAPRQSRYVAAVLSALVCGLLVLAIIAMTAIRDLGPGNATILTALRLVPPPVEKQKKIQPHKSAQAPKPAQQTAPAATMKIPPHINVNNQNKVDWPDGFIHTNHLDMANGDIAKIHSGVAPGNAQASGGGGHSMGDGPDDQGFYKAEWYRKPPQRALDLYMKPGQDMGRWAEVSCRMIENYKVEDCHELAEEPRGSGMARVLREASWQFQVRPPKRDGKVLLGERVRIHYDFIRHQAEEVPDVLPGAAP
jgi:protein TonB